jgi:hypothetical protein
MLHEMITGRHPYAGLAVPVLAARVASADPVTTCFDDHAPAELADLATRCMAKDAQQRPRASEATEILERALDLPSRRSGSAPVPFPGLVAQRERDASGFFGRDPEIHAFVELMRREAVLPPAAYAGRATAGAGGVADHGAAQFRGYGWRGGRGSGAVRPAPG